MPIIKNFNFAIPLPLQWPSRFPKSEPLDNKWGIKLDCRDFVIMKKTLNLYIKQCLTYSVRLTVFFSPWHLCNKNSYHSFFKDVPIFTDPLRFPQQKIRRSKSKGYSRHHSGTLRTKPPDKELSWRTGVTGSALTEKKGKSVTLRWK